MIYVHHYSVVVTAFVDNGDSVELLRIHKDRLTEKEARDQKRELTESILSEIQKAISEDSCCRINNLFFYPNKYAAIKVS